ncbi:MAG: hypothetical protein WAN08_13070 [Candidatus Sulfotelmatobacter sp.]
MKQYPAPRKWAEASIVGGKPQFPSLATFRPECIRAGDRGKEVPGIYRLTVWKSGRRFVWIGQTKDLQRCPFKDYFKTKPDDGVERDNVVHDVLADAESVKVEFIPECDLGAGITRKTAEAQEQNRAIDDNEYLLNKCGGRSGLGYGHYLKFKVAYHKRIGEGAERELGNWERQHS